MTSLSDQIDRFTRHTRAIKTTASSLSSLSSQTSSGPFVRAVLHAHLGDLIRDIDSSELGLFTLVKPALAPLYDRDNHSARVSEIQRTNFSGATPLRKQPRRDESIQAQDIEPEIFAWAALKYMDRYKPIRPMPRAHAQVLDISDRLNVIRDSIASLSLTLQQSQSADPTPVKVLLEEEESNIRNTQERIELLKKRRSSYIETATTKQMFLVTPPTRPRLSTSPQEDKFWNTPAVISRTLNFTDNLLMEEDVNIGDISTMSFTSPFQEAPASLIFQSAEQPSTPLTLGDTYELTASDPSIYSSQLEDGKAEIITIGVHEPPLSQDTLMESGQVRKSHSPEHEGTLPLEPTQDLIQSGNSSLKIKINDEVEKIIVKIWTTIGDVIMPGHPSSISRLTPSKKKPPLAKETITYLHQLTQTPRIGSSSASSMSATPMTINEEPLSQRALTAHLLICLLSSPNLCIPLNKLKTIMAEKLNANGSSILTHGQSSTRIIYSCVAKRLIKINRGKGEQMVTFDV